VAEFAISGQTAASQLASGGRSLFSASGFTLRELAQVPKLRIQTVRGRSGALPRVLPETPNTLSGTDPWILWRAPGDWMAYSITMPYPALTQTIAEDAPDCVLTDVSSGIVLLELSGQRTVDILMRDCTLDLDGGEIGIGRCAQTVLAQVNVLLHPCGTGPAWRLFVERSVAVHLWDWLVDTAEGG